MSLFKKKPKLEEELDLNTLKTLLNTNTPFIFEIGCNDGTHTKKFLDVFPNAKIYAFEPDPRAQKRFLDNVGKDERITLFTKAISSTNGTIEFHMSDGVPDENWKEELPEGWDFSGSIRKPKEHLELHPWCKFDKTIEVDTQTLDSFCVENNISSIDFIWADVQGAEIDLIKGGLNSLAFTKYFYTEYNDKELYEGQISLKEIDKLLPNFEIHTTFVNDVLLKNKNC